MKEVDDFLQLLLDNESDDRIEITKKMKYGYRNYYISFNIDDKPSEDNNNQSYGRFRIADSLEVIVDNRNCCIEILYDQHTSNIIIEDKQLVDRWSNIFEEYINRDVPEKITKVVENTLSSCYNKNLYRTYQMKKILPEDESL